MRRDQVKDKFTILVREREELVVSLQIQQGTELVPVAVTGLWRAKSRRRLGKKDCAAGITDPPLPLATRLSRVVVPSSKGEQFPQIVAKFNLRGD
jgi:hypothetical protein